MESTKPVSILLVDDEPLVRDLCKAVLTNKGFEILTATNGKEGLATYLANQDQICLVVSDVTMPVMDGVEMIRNILLTESRPGVVLMSGDFSCLGSDVLTRLCSVLPKPFTPAQLVKVVHHCLEYQREQPEVGEAARSGGKFHTERVQTPP